MANPNFVHEGGSALADSLIWRILVTANNANSATYSVGAVLLA